MKKNIYILETITVITLTIFLSSCSSSSRYRLLSTFFDGVPNPNAKKKEVVDSSKIAGQNDVVVKKERKPEFVFHPPYQNRMCSACHNINKGNELVKSVPDLCYKCHETFTDKNPALHGPVAMGECNVCHSPHLAENAFLLKRKGRDLCLYCHDSNDIMSNKNHFATEEHSCLDCHDPHSGKDRFMLN